MTDDPREDRGTPPSDRGTPNPRPAEPYRPPEPTAPVRVPPTPARPEPQRPVPTVEPPRADPSRAQPPTRAAPPARAEAPTRAEPPAADQRTPADLDEFLARAVDRQIAEQRALREALQELTNAVRELQSRPPQQPAVPSLDAAEIEARVARAIASAAPAIDPAEIEARIARAVASNTETLLGELRDLRSTVVPGVQRASEASSGSRAIEHDMSILRDAVGGLSADVEGIAQALIDLNAGLRDWADGIDRNVDVVIETVQQARDVAAKVEQLQLDAIERAERREAESRPLLPVEGELVDIDETGVIPAPTALARPGDVPSEIEQRVKETIELSLYLADQIESFDKVISNLGDLPSRLEGVISQALKRTLAARAKLDRDAEMALDEAVATLDEHVATIGDLSSVAEAQLRVEAGLAALAEAVDRSADGGLPRAGTSLARASAPKRKPARKAKRASGRKPAASTSDRKPAASTSKAKSKSSGGSSKAKAAKRSAPKRKRKPGRAEYLSLDAEPNIPDGD